MAGSFSSQREKYRLLLEIGQRALFPEQIEQITGCRTEHIAQFLSAR
jgi:hypothetical protein